MFLHWVFLFNFGCMKATVIRAFTCINTRVHYAVGTTYEADAQRINHLVSKGYVKAGPAHIPKAEVPAPSKAEAHPFALLSHDPKTVPIIKPKRKRNESK